MWFNNFVGPILRSPLHGIISSNTLIVNYTGVASGRQYNVPVNYVYDDADLLILSNRERVWWRNLRDGRRCTITLKGKDIATTSVVYEDEPAVARQLAVYVKAAPQIAKYLKIPMHNGEPDRATLTTLAQKHVMIRIQLAD